MTAVKTPEVRRLVSRRMGAWRYWKTVHTWVYLSLGACSSATATFVAANSKYDIVPQKHAWIAASLSAVFTFAVSTVGAQAEAKSFQLGGRLLAAALAKYDTDPDYGDVELGRALASAEEALSKGGM